MGTANRPYAVITGASSGIGFELAKECSLRGFDILICAEDAGIHEAAHHLGATGAVVDCVRADLATYEGCEKLVEAVNAADRPLDALLLNAGVGIGGAFVYNDLDDVLRMIGLNVNSVVHLAKRLVPRMIARGRGRVLVTASVAPTAPTPFLAVHGATKAFDLAFAEALRYELKDTGVTVTVLEPGATDTEFFERADMENTMLAQGAKDDPEQVASKGFEAMMEGRDSIVAGSVRSTLEGIATDLLPESAKAALLARQARPGSAEKHTVRELSKKHS